MLFDLLQVNKLLINKITPVYNVLMQVVCDEILSEFEAADFDDIVSTN